MSSLSDETDEEDEDSSAYLDEMIKDPTFLRAYRKWVETHIREELPKKLPRVIREYFRDGSWHAPKDAIQGIKSALLYRRITQLLRKAIKSGLNAAVRRRIIQRHRGGYIISHRRFADYDDAFLETHLLSVIGRTSVERLEVPILLARQLGFKITTPAIKQTTERLIRHLIRNNWLEKSGRTRIRRL